MSTFNFTFLHSFLFPRLIDFTLIHTSLERPKKIIFKHPTFPWKTDNEKRTYLTSNHVNRCPTKCNMESRYSVTEVSKIFCQNRTESVWKNHKWIIKCFLNVHTQSYMDVWDFLLTLWNYIYLFDQAWMSSVCWENFWAGSEADSGHMTF